MTRLAHGLRFRYGYGPRRVGDDLDTVRRHARQYLASIRENTKTRELIVQTNQDTRIELRGDIKALDTKVAGLDSRVAGLDSRVEGLEGQVTELKRTTEKNYDELRRDHNELKRTVENNHEVLGNALADTRERLARIEGHLKIAMPTSVEPEQPD
ncbi:MAG: hypothetical protein F4Z58_01715 [Acidimicrobiaceae bacterium]|nr:hypothetical protein [Acidimicrobiaceae bacterium]MYD07975.1 hypothetical protein [Acidimicrobiaceae bacterium]MYI58437.1 hypothetical protein [Acidimicrobiaceae bacterium]